MDSASLFLTANCDTIYFIIVPRSQCRAGGADIPALWSTHGHLRRHRRHVVRMGPDLGVPGPDRGLGGRYLVVGPGYAGPLPDSGFHVCRARTARVVAFGRAFLVDNDPPSPSKRSGTASRSIPMSPVVTGPRSGPSSPEDHRRRSRRPFPTPRSSRVGLLVQHDSPQRLRITGTSSTPWFKQEPAGAGDPEILGLLASVGIVKGTPFDPDDRMRKILEDAVAVGNATARTLSFAPRPAEGFAFYPDSQWFNMLFVGGYNFLDPPPQITPQGAVPSPSDGARKINARIAFFYPYTGITPAMCMLLTGIGSQYLMAMRTATASTSMEGATTGSACRLTFRRAGSGR